MTDPKASFPRQMAFLQAWHGWGAILRLGAAILCAVLGWQMPALTLLAAASLCALAFFLRDPGFLNFRVVLVGVEWTVLIVSFLLYFGAGAGFQLHVITLTIITLMFERNRLPTRLVMAAIPILGLILIFPWFASLPSLIPITPRTAVALDIGNMVLFALFTVGVVLYYTQSTRRAKQEAESLALQRAELITNLSHELKTPLAAVMTQVQMTLSRDRTPADYREALSRCERNTRSMAQLVDRMLNAATLEQADQPLPLSPVRPAALARTIREDLAPLLSAGNLTLDIEADDSLGLQTDPDGLTGILYNLLSNAVKYSPEGGRIRLQIKEGSDRGLVFRVSDQGPGIPAKIRSSIFEPFFRADKSRSRGQGSHGLGLSIARSSARRLGGELILTDEPGPGASFVLRLPENPPGA